MDFRTMSYSKTSSDHSPDGERNLKPQPRFAIHHV